MSGLWAIIDPVSRVCLAIRRDLPEDDEVGINIVVAVDKAPNADEIAIIEDSMFVGWVVCEVRQEANAAHRIIAKFADPLQAQIYSIKEKEACWALTYGERFNANWEVCCPVLQTEANETNVDLLELAQRVVDRATKDRSRFASAVAIKEARRRREKVEGRG
jgi:hypothetical protein